MLTLPRLSPLVFAAVLTSLGCHAQTSITAGSTLPPSVTHRIEVLLRQKAQLPPESVVTIGPAQPSEVPGFSTFSVSFTTEGKTSHPVNFMIANDGKTVAQFTKYDVSSDPRSVVSAEGRPARGGPASAPVDIVNFDDLECPYCARLHTTMFPAITQRYGDKVHIVYKDFPLDQHPWAMRAAVDVDCLGAQSAEGYWNLVDDIHARASEIGSDPRPASADPKEDPKTAKPEHSLDRANAQLDKLTRDQGTARKVDGSKLDACIAKQDTSAIEASKRIGTALNVDSTPTFFINGAKFDGAVHLDFLFSMIDDALRAQNITPPPPYVAPTVLAPAK